MRTRDRGYEGQYADEQNRVMDVVCWLTVEDGADLVVVHQHRDVKRVGAEEDDCHGRLGSSGDGVDERHLQR